MRGRSHSPSDECQSLETVLISPYSTAESYLWWRVEGGRGEEREGGWDGEGGREGGRT